MKLNLNFNLNPSGKLFFIGLFMFSLGIASAPSIFAGFMIPFGIGTIFYAGVSSPW